MVDHTAAGSRRGEHGQSSLEWIGVAAVAVAVVAALVLAAGRLGGPVGDAVVCLVSRVVDGAAACAGPGLAPGEPSSPCVVRSVGGTAAAGVRVAIVDLETGDAYIREERSDGTIAVTFIESGSLGVSAQLGGGASAEVGGVGGGVEVEAEAGVAVEGYVGEARLFTDPDEADQYIQDRLTDEVIEALPMPLELPASGVRWVIDRLTGHQTPTGDAGPTTGAVGIAAEAQAEGAVGPGRAEAQAAARAGAQVQINPDGSMEVTIAVTGTGSLGGSTGPVTATAESSREVTITVVLAPDGTPTALRADAALDGRLSGGLAGDLPIAGIPGIEGTLSGGAGTTGTVSVTLDLTDPDIGPAGRDMVTAIGAGLGAGGSLDAVIGVSDDLLEELEDAATITVVTHRTDEDSAAGEISGNIGVGLGAEVDVGRATAEVMTAHYWDPQQNRFVPWITCTR